MSKPAYEVWVRDMDDQMSMATPEGKPGIFDTVGEAEKWALDLSDSPNIMYAYVIQRRVSRTFDGKGLIQKRIQDAKKKQGGSTEGETEFPEQGFAESP